MQTSAVEPVKDDEHNALQQHLQLEAFRGKYLTAQEILLVQLFQSETEVSSSIAGTNSTNSDVSLPTPSTASPGSLNKVRGASSARITSLGSMGKAVAGGVTPPSVATPKPQVSTDRARVQSFLAQRSSASVGIPSSNITGNSGATAAKQPISVVERAKLLMAKRTGGTRTSSSAAVKRTNPLTDILKGGSGSVVGGVQSIKKSKSVKSNKPGEIKIQGGRTSIQLPLESFLRNEDWDSSTGTPLDLVLPEVAFATNNTLIIHATLPPRSSRCCFNISTQSSMLSGAPYPGTVLYHFNPRRHRGGHIIQNSNIDSRWGCSQPLPRFPITFGEPFTLRLTIVSTGLLVFIEEIFQDEFKHRVPIREGENLVLTVPTRDENGNPESVIVHSVWWGHAEVPSNLDTRRRGSNGHAEAPSTLDTRKRESSAGYRGGDRTSHRSGNSGRGGDRFHPAPHPYEVYVGNLPQGTSREELSFLFQYLGYESVRITARGFGFVTLRSAEDMHRAVEGLDGKEFNGMKLRVSCALPPK
ncbi:31 kda chloroplastic-like [Plasmopara halstedii]|uniref:Galectin n=1 Tax=Plasmopara halstedii TaxID=4781 RepID=A0A0P1AG20_PLAHL|nr:31 kda chloroplastic-like [Plasmopara halstedii]CEG39989.1 31 kda chloroplastic-like [Plasmopara halstedii]|eukprot:XP_024576358.1 31 kda chloroplastic-like [Plasmopara halstedii]